MPKIVKRKIRSPIKQQLLLTLELLLLGGRRSVSYQQWFFRSFNERWKNLNRKYLRQLVREFRTERLISYREQPNGLVDIILTEKGKRQLLRFNLDRLELKRPKSWNGRWTLVIFDIPEKRKKGREALRHKLQELGFIRLQKSTFVFPYPCRKEIDFIVECFELRPYVTYGELVNPTNEAALKLKFDLV